MGVILRSRGATKDSLDKFRRNLRKWRADIHIVSYPKCGRTWLVLLIAKTLELHYGMKVQNPLKLREYRSRRRGIPYMHAHHDGGPEFLLPEELETNKGFYASRRVIFMVRDPRDVLVSSYFQKTKRNYNFKGSMSEYVKERRGGIETIIDFYNIWAQNRNIPKDFLLVRYEDMQTDTASELRRVLKFIGVEGVSPENVQQAVELCSFDNMRQMESNNAFKTNTLSPRDVNDPQTYKTRRGIVGGYKDYLDGEDLNYVEDIIRQRLDPFFGEYVQGTGTTDQDRENNILLNC